MALTTVEPARVSAVQVKIAALAKEATAAQAAQAAARTAVESCRVTTMVAHITITFTHFRFRRMLLRRMQIPRQQRDAAFNLPRS